MAGILYNSADGFISARRAALGEILLLMRIVVLFTTIFTLCIVGARGIGSLRHAPINDLFTEPDGSPCAALCLFGIKPGRMSADEAIHLLETHPLTRQLTIDPGDGGGYLTARRGSRTSITMSVMRGQVVWVQLDYVPEEVLPAQSITRADTLLDSLLMQVSRGDVVAFGGQPCFTSMNLDTGLEQLWLTYQNNKLVFSNKLTVKPGTRPRIGLRDSTLMVYLTNTASASCVEQTWRGFGGFAWPPY